MPDGFYRQSGIITGHPVYGLAYLPPPNLAQLFTDNLRRVGWIKKGNKNVKKINKKNLHLFRFKIKICLCRVGTAIIMQAAEKLSNMKGKTRKRV